LAGLVREFELVAMQPLDNILGFGSGFGSSGTAIGLERFRSPSAHPQYIRAPRSARRTFSCWGVL